MISIERVIAGRENFTLSLNQLLLNHCMCPQYVMSPALPMVMALEGGGVGSWTQGVGGGVGVAKHPGEGRVQIIYIVSL